MFKYFDWKYIVMALILLGGFVFSHLYYSNILSSIKCIFEFPFLNLYAGGVATIFTVLHKIKTRKISFNANMSFKDFQTSMSDIISFVDNPIIIVCSLALAKGLFLQSIEGKVYYPFFNGLEVTFILLVTLYLLFISLMEMWKNIKETCWRLPVNITSAHATPVTETLNKEVPKPEQ